MPFRDKLQRKSAEVIYSIRKDHRDSTRCSDVLSVLRTPTIARIYRQCRTTLRSLTAAGAAEFQAVGIVQQE